MPKIERQSNQLKNKVPRNGIGATRILNCGTKRLLLILFVLSFICLSVIPNLTVARIFYIYLEQNDVSVVLDNYYDLPRQPEHEDKLENKSMSTTMIRNPSASNAVVDRPAPVTVVEYIYLTLQLNIMLLIN